MAARLLKKLVSTAPCISGGNNRCNGGVRETKKELPDDIIEEVLSRLPAECVLKCRAVCKRWLLLTCSSYFAELHRKRATPVPLIQNTVKPITYDDLELFMFYGHKKGIRGRSSSRRAVALRGGSDGLVNFNVGRGDKLRQCCDGLLVFDAHCGRRFQVCNFVTREQVNVESPLHMRSLYLLFHAIFLHPTTKQYMMLFSSYKQGHPEADYYMFVLGNSSSSNSWRKVGSFHCKPEHNLNPVVFNNNLIWMTSLLHSNATNPGCNNSIIMFDTVAEEFRTRPHPPQHNNKCCTSGKEHLMMYMFETKGKLQFCSVLFKIVSLWVLEDFDNWSWTKRQNVFIHLYDTIPFLRRTRWSGKTAKATNMKAEHDKLLLCYARRLYLLDLNENKIVLKLKKNFKTSNNRLCQIPSTKTSTFNLFWYTRTFVSINGSSPPFAENSVVPKAM